MATKELDVTTKKSNEGISLGRTPLGKGESLKLVAGEGNPVEVKFHVPRGTPFSDGLVEFGIDEAGTVKIPDAGAKGLYRFNVLGPKEGAIDRPDRPVRTGEIDITTT